MKTIRTLLTALIFAGWIATIGVFSIQNITPVSFKIFNLQTVEAPIGIWLAFSLGIGMVAASVAPIIFSRPHAKKLPRSPRRKKSDPTEENINYQREIEEDDPLTGDWGQEGRGEW
ncbi:MAG: LapA family protein [Spirulinaceae cyanobacterium]